MLTADIAPGRRPRGAGLIATGGAYRAPSRDHRPDRHGPDERACNEPGADDREPTTAGLLHRHHGLHRLQGVRGGLQGMEPAPGDGLILHRHVVRQHGRARPDHLAARGVHRAACGRTRRAAWLAVHASDVCKHCTRRRLPGQSARRARFSGPNSAPCSCSRTSATAAATASPPARSASSTAAPTTDGPGSARSATTG